MIKLRTITYLIIFLLLGVKLQGKGFGYNYNLEVTEGTPDNIEKLFFDVGNGGYEAEKRIVPKWKGSRDIKSVEIIINASSPRSVSWGVARQIIEGMPINDHDKVGALLKYLDEYNEPIRQINVMTFLRKWMETDPRVLNAYIERINDDRDFTDHENPENVPHTIGQTALSSVLDILVYKKLIDRGKESEISRLPFDLRKTKVLVLLRQHNLIEEGLVPPVNVNDKKPFLKTNGRRGLRDESKDEEGRGRKKIQATITSEEVKKSHLIIVVVGLMLLGILAVFFLKRQKLL